LCSSASALSITDASSSSSSSSSSGNKSSLQSGHVECRSTNQYLDILNKVLLHFNDAVDDEEFVMQRANFMLNTILLKEPTTAASA